MIRAKFLDLVLLLQRNMHFLHIAYRLSCCIFCTNCCFRSAGTIAPRSVRLEKFTGRDLRSVLDRIAEAFQMRRSRVFDDGFGESLGTHCFDFVRFGLY